MRRLPLAGRPGEYVRVDEQETAECPYCQLSIPTFLGEHGRQISTHSLKGRKCEGSRLSEAGAEKAKQGLWWTEG